MSLTIEHPEAERLARELALRHGRTVEEVVTLALKQALAVPLLQPRVLASNLLMIAEEFRRLPRLDDRSDDDILGYGERGLPTQW